MSLTIELCPATEEHLRREAARLGIAVGEYASRLLDTHLQSLASDEASGTTISPDAWLQRFYEWTETHYDLPQLPPEAFERQSFYEDRA